MTDMAIVPAQIMLSDNRLKLSGKPVIGNLVAHHKPGAVPVSGIIAAPGHHSDSSRRGPVKKDIKVRKGFRLTVRTRF